MKTTIAIALASAAICLAAVGDTIAYGGRTFEVMAPGGEPVWRWSDPYHQVYRIHTKCVSEE